MRIAPDHSGERIMDVDLTPMIDVVFLLIIFFMATAQFARLTKADIELPREQGETQRAEEASGVVINISPAGELIVDGDSYSLDRVVAMVKVELKRAGGAPGALDLLIRADKDAPASVVNTLADRLVEAGVRSWRLGTEPGSGGGA
ncbi:MAG: biopolymer transporter ExbD [Phycisphaeraceae bacterium]|nr:biopolymer transporter ExbD [Phycisphaeraceae bacterium]MCB9848327.1 biopolymer transporter ExbD [Phycisphaeraceae bacterium]